MGAGIQEQSKKKESIEGSTFLHILGWFRSKEITKFLKELWMYRNGRMHWSQSMVVDPNNGRWASDNTNVVHRMDGK